MKIASLFAFMGMFAIVALAAGCGGGGKDNKADIDGDLDEELMCDGSEEWGDCHLEDDMGLVYYECDGDDLVKYTFDECVANTCYRPEVVKHCEQGCYWTNGEYGCRGDEPEADGDGDKELMCDGSEEWGDCEIEFAPDSSTCEGNTLLKYQYDACVPIVCYSYQPIEDCPFGCSVDNGEAHCNPPPVDGDEELMCDGSEEWGDCSYEMEPQMYICQGDDLMVVQDDICVPEACYKYVLSKHCEFGCDYNHCNDPEEIDGDMEYEWDDEGCKKKSEGGC